MQDHLFIAKIPPEFSSEQVMALLASVGEVKNFHRPNKRETGQPETYAFATLASEELAQLAIDRLNNHIFDEKHPPLVVKFADNRQAPTNLFVAKIPTTFTDEQITALFAEIGTVKQFHRPKRKNGDPQKYAFMTMESPEAAQKAVETLDGHPLGGDFEPLVVKFSNERSESPKTEESAAKPKKENFKKYDELAAQIAEQLGETESKPINLIKRIIQKCGIEQTQAWVAETMQIEEQGGLMIERLDRRRTTGGVFFYISKAAMPPDIMNIIFPKDMWGKKKKAKTGGQAPAQPPVEEYPPFDWEQRAEVLNEMLHEEGGKVNSVKVVVVGRPDSVKININEVTLTVKRNFQLTHVPKGVPHPTPFTTITTVYVPLKMWNKVQEALKDPEDRLVVEGFVAIEPNKPGYSVYGTLVTTANLQRARFAKSDSPEQG